MAGDGATLHFGSWNSRDFTVQYVRRGMDVGVARYLGSVPFALPLSPTGDVVEIALEDCREVPYSQLPVVFVVDDDIDLCRTVQRLLVAAGYEVCIYHSADEFLAAGERHRSGCVVLDIRMPGISGPELHRQLVAGGSEMAVVIASARDTKTIPATVSQTSRELATGLKARVSTMRINSKRELYVEIACLRREAGPRGPFIEVIKAVDSSGKTIGVGRINEGDPLSLKGNVIAEFTLTGKGEPAELEITVVTESSVKTIPFEIGGIFQK